MGDLKSLLTEFHPSAPKLVYLQKNCYFFSKSTSAFMHQNKLLLLRLIQDVSNNHWYVNKRVIMI